jgi:hypothetical protein
VKLIELEIGELSTNSIRERQAVAGSDCRIRGVRKQLSRTSACKNDSSPPINRPSWLRRIGRLTRYCFHADCTAVLDNDFGYKTTLDNFHACGRECAAECLLDVKAGCIAAGVQDTADSMRTFETQRQLAVLSIKRHIQAKQITYSPWSLVGQNFDGTFIAQPCSCGNCVFEVYL